MRFPKTISQSDILIIMSRHLSFDIKDIEDMVYTIHLWYELQTTGNGELNIL